MSTGHYPSDDFTGKLMVMADVPLKEFEMVVPPISVGQRYLNFIPQSSPEIVRKLALRDDVRFILPDLEVEFDTIDPAKGSANWATDSFQAKDILRTEQVWNEFGIDGSGVTIGITDSGVDFGNSDLVNAAKLDPSGYTASFDPTGFGIALGDLELESTVVDDKEYLPISGKNITFWQGESGSLATVNEVGLQLEDLEITDIPTKSISGSYRIGISYQPGVVENIPDQFFLFVLVDSTNQFEYDTLYVDFSTSLALSLVQNGLILESGRTYQSLVDWSLNDEPEFNKDNPILARDLTDDGINDVSMGALGTTLDLYSVTPGIPIVKGIDPSGQAIGVIYDVVGHGTSTSTAALGRGITSYLVYDDPATPEKIENSTSYKLSGSAPGANLIATKGYSLNDFILGWFWTSGLELNIVDDEIGWVENTNHLVDISSNSWGTGEIAYENELRGLDFYSLFLDFLSTKNAIYSGYPGVLFVVSSGNGGPGFGTSARPSMASMAITVGASTYFHFLNGSTGRNEVAWFSSRGPTPYGSIKPDLVAPGHTGFLPIPVIAGYGNGTYARSTFGGTSESAPRVAGIVALMIEALESKDIPVTFETIKLTLQSTSMDLSYHPAQQGAGLADAYRAVSSVMRSDQVLIGNDVTSSIIGNRLQNAFRHQFGSDVDHPLVSDPIREFSLIATPELLQSGIPIAMEYQNGTQVGSSQYSADPQQYHLQASDEISISSSNTEVQENIGNLLPSGWDSVDLLEFSAVLTLSSYEALAESGLGTPELVLTDTGSGDIIADTLSQLTWAQLLYSGDPSDDFEGDPRITFTDPGYAANINAWDGLTYNIGVRGFSYQDWSGVSADIATGAFNLNGIIPQESDFASIHVSADGLQHRVPIHLHNIYQARKTTTLPAIGEDLQETGPHMINGILGAHDLGYRPESGDFRYYQIAVPQNSSYLALYGQWDTEGLVPDFWLFNSSGNLLQTSDVQYIGNGAYRSTTSEEFSQNIIIESHDTNYYLLVHFARVPFIPGPYEFRVHARYIDDPNLPIPTPEISQSLDLPITGDLNIDASNYHADQFPELEVVNVVAQVYQGQSKNFTQSIDNIALKDGPAPRNLTFNDFDTFFTGDFSAGEVVDMALTWEGDLDVDIYVFNAQSTLDRKNDLLKGLGTNPGNNFEYGRFTVEESGLYLFYIDYVDGLQSSNLELTLEYDSRKGPFITDDAPQLTIPTTIFPNGGYGLRLVYVTNFNIFFETRSDIILVNHDPFTLTLDAPNSGDVLQGEVSVEWTTDSSTSADVFVVQNGVSVRVATNRVAGQATFDSRLFANGLANIRVEASDGVYVEIAEVEVEFDNESPASLPAITTSQNQNLPLFVLSELLGISVLIGVYRRRRNKQ